MKNQNQISGVNSIDSGFFMPHKGWLTAIEQKICLFSSSLWGSFILRGSITTLPVKKQVLPDIDPGIKILIVGLTSSPDLKCRIHKRTLTGGRIAVSPGGLVQTRLHVR